MKSKDKSNKKGHENTIGKIIYGFLLFMPLLAIAVTCAYVIFNKNAYESYSQQSNEDIEYSVANELVAGERYYFNSRINSLSNTSGSQKVQFFYIDNVDIEYTSYTWFNNSVKRINLYLNNNSSNLIIYAYDSNNVSLGSATLYNEYQISFYFNYVSTNNNSSYDYFKNTFYEYTPLIDTNRTLDNVFYYSIEKVEQSPLFSWSKDSLIYTGMNNTCQALDISNTFIPMILSYWLIMSVIYFLYDIILIILHVFHRKIHQLEESI